MERAILAAQAKVQQCRAQLNAFAEVDEFFDADQQEQMLPDIAGVLDEMSRKAADSLRVAFELSGLDHHLVEFVSRLSQFDDGDYSKVDYFDEYYGAHTPITEFLSAQLSLLTPLVTETSSTAEQLGMLFGMLSRTAYYLEKSGNVPCREKDVQDALEIVLSMAFPDLIREPTTAKQTKAYKPDFGIESIDTAIETKYLDESGKAGIALGEIYEDMRGFAGSEYKYFVAVIYMTGHFLTQAQVEAEWKKVGAAKSWRLILAVGPHKPKPVKAKKPAQNS